MRFKMLCIIPMLFSSWGLASTLTFQFINPNFGGNPSNGSFLLSQAGAQNSYKDPDADDWSYDQPTALENFTSSIQSQLLGSLMNNVSQGKPGSIITNDFMVNVVNTDGQLVMNITDRKTGQKSTIQIKGIDSEY